MGKKQSKIIGYVQTRDIFNPEHPLSQSILDCREIFNSQDWNLQNGRLNKSKIRNVLGYIKTAKIKSLNLANNVENIPLLLIQIHFPNLQNLKLCGNNIYSIQCLVFLSAQYLIELTLSWNNIISIRSLSRCRFPRLKYLNLQQNPIKRMGNDIKNCWFPQLRVLTLQLNGKSCIVDDFIESQIMQMQTSYLYELNIMSVKRILMRNRKILKQKYTNLKVIRNIDEIQKQ